MLEICATVLTFGSKTPWDIGITANAVFEAAAESATISLVINPATSVTARLSL